MYSQIQLERLVAFVQSHGNRVLSATATEITAETEEHDGKEWRTVVETFPATLSAARDWLGY